MPQTAILCLLAGVLAANATPHFVKGITKEPFPRSSALPRWSTSSPGG